MAADDGASPRELLFEACRRNNITLLRSTLATAPSAREIPSIAELINTSRDGIGNTCLHVAVMHGSYDILDTLLDQHDVEVDPLDRMEGDTPLHKAVRFSNDSASSAAADTISSDSGAKDLGHAMVEMLIDAGADPRVRNKGKLKAVELVDPRDTGLRVVLQKAEYAMLLGDDHAGFDEGGEEKDAGSGSD